MAAIGTLPLVLSPQRQAGPSTQAPKATTAPLDTPIHRLARLLHRVASSTLTSTSCIVSATDITRVVGLQHESICLVVTHCPLLPHIPCLLSTRFDCLDPQDSAVANHQPPALLATATGPLHSAARLLRSGSLAILAKIRGHLPHALLARYPASFLF